MDDYAPLYRFLARIFLRLPDEATLGLASDLLDEPGLTVDPQRHTWLFDFNVYPYASVFLDPSGMLGAPWSGFVAGVYKALGLEVATDAGLAAPDHLSAQLEVLATLLEREAAATSKVEAERSKLAQKTLLTEQLLPWLPTFKSAVVRLDDGLYGRLTELALDLTCEHAAALLGADSAPPLSLATQGELTEETDANARAQLERFYTPARSGMYLSREDIMTLGRRLGLPVRFAERSFMLEQLALAAADAGKLAELFLELRKLAQQHEAELASLQKAYPRLAGISRDQRGRLEATAAELLVLSRAVDELPE